MTGPGIVLALLLMWSAFNVFVIIDKYRHPERPPSKYTLGTVIFGIFVTLLLVSGQIYLAAV